MGLVPVLGLPALASHFLLLSLVLYNTLYQPFEPLALILQGLFVYLHVLVLH